jgi:hypothetical protein
VGNYLLFVLLAVFAVLGLVIARWYLAERARRFRGLL